MPLAVGRPRGDTLVRVTSSALVNTHTKCASAAVISGYENLFHGYSSGENDKL